MKAMIFAAGLGTRLRPLTDSRPKALVEVAGKPLIEHVFTKLIAAGYDDIVVNVHHFADMLQDYILSRNCFGVKVAFCDERDFLRDTGGGILHARKLLEGTGSFLVHNVDILSDIDLKEMRTGFDASRMMALLSVSRRQSSRRLLFDSGMRLVGWKNLTTGQIRSPYFDPPAPASELAFSGIHIISDKIFPLMEEYSVRGNCQGRFSIIDFYLSICGSHPVYGHLQDPVRLFDVGKIDVVNLLATAFPAEWQRD